MTELSTDQLVERGRDREAVDKLSATLQAAATRHEEGKPMDGVQQLDEIIPLLREVVAGIAPQAHGAATPCATFDVQGVLEHMIGGATMFAPAFRGGPGPVAPADEGDSVERWQHAMTDLLDSVHTDGARERIIPTPFGQMPGEQFARYVAFDGLLHGWDLSVATDQAYRPSEDVVAAVDAYARGLLQPEMRDGDMFAAEAAAPDWATPMERLVAFTGRTVI